MAKPSCTLLSWTGTQLEIMLHSDSVASVGSNWLELFEWTPHFANYKQTEAGNTSHPHQGSSFELLDNCSGGLNGRRIQHVCDYISILSRNMKPTCRASERQGSYLYWTAESWIIFHVLVSSCETFAKVWRYLKLILELQLCYLYNSVDMKQVLCFMYLDLDLMNEQTVYSFCLLDCLILCSLTCQVRAQLVLGSCWLTSRDASPTESKHASKCEWIHLLSCKTFNFE